MRRLTYQRVSGDHQDRYQKVGHFFLRLMTHAEGEQGLCRPPAGPSGKAAALTRMRGSTAWKAVSRYER